MAEPVAGAATSPQPFQVTQLRFICVVFEIQMNETEMMGRPMDGYYDASSYAEQTNGYAESGYHEAEFESTDNVNWPATTDSVVPTTPPKSSQAKIPKDDENEEENATATAEVATSAPMTTAPTVETPTKTRNTNKSEHQSPDKKVPPTTSRQWQVLVIY